MNRGLYTAAAGMSANQVWLDTVANNLANSNTIGFKRDEIAFEESLKREMRNGLGTGEPLGDLQSGPQAIGTSTTFQVGALQATGRGLDAAITTERGMFGVQTPSGVAYTRAGSFTLNERREIVDMNGNPVLDPSERPITVDRPGMPEILPDGRVMIGEIQVGKLGLFVGQFSKAGNNLFTGRGVSADETVTLSPRSTEASNVNPVQTMIEMVQVQRMFELAQRSVMSHDEMTGRLIQRAGQNQ